MYKVLGVGTDLCQIGRMRELLEKKSFLLRCFSEAELEWVASRGAVAADSLAGLWAAKEAVLKALGTGLQLPMLSIEIGHTELGQPVCSLSGRALERCAGGEVLVSISHEGDMACAFCVWQGEDGR